MFCECVLSLSQNIVLFSPFFLWWWDDEMLCDEMKWSEWWGHCDVALGYYRPDNVSEGRSSAPDYGWPQVTESMESQTAD